MTEIEKAVLIVGIAAIVYYAYTKLEIFKEKIEDKLDFIP